MTHTNCNHEATKAARARCRKDTKMALIAGDALEAAGLVKTLAVGDVVTAASCGRADNVQFMRHDVTGTVTKLMGASLAFKDDEGSLYFASVKDCTTN
jgi:hypothetical protein